MADERKEQEGQKKASARKKPYTPPRLTIHGPVTQTAEGGSAPPEEPPF